jgi:hypothetical protein
MRYGFSQIAADLKEYGPCQVAEGITLRSVNRVMFLKVLHCLKVDTVSQEFLAPPTGYRGAFLEYAQLRKLTNSPEWELSEDFLKDAFAKGDRCYGFTRNGELAAYQWYATAPTQTDWRGMVANFNSDYVYMYKGFTHPKHRGHRLYPVGVTTVLAEYMKQGCRGFLSIVESNNFASLKSCRRMGYRDVGKILIAALFDRCLLKADPSCETYGLRLTKGSQISIAQEVA